MAQLLDKPPAQPPEIASQMGGNPPPFAPVGQKMAAQPPGAGGPAAAVEAVKKVIEQVAKQTPAMAPFCARAMAILDAGLEQAAGAASPQPGGQQTPPQTAKPPEGAGGGFPG